jgi:hypothetical protein
VRIDGSALREDGWHLADRNVFGELATEYLLRVGAEQEEATAAAAGWDGDRYELWRREVAPGECAYPCRAELVLVASWAWDTAADADQFERAATTYIEAGLQGQGMAEHVWQVEGGYAALTTGPRSTVLAFAPSAGLSRRVSSSPP